MAPRYSRIFLLSHMRAYTSLLGHILGSHPEIDGYYELHRSYSFADDLAEQEAQFAAHDSPKPDSRYLFDKLLHNDYVLNLALPELADAVVLLALRPPEPTLKSIVALFSGKNAGEPYASPEGATRYYLERLGALAEFSARHPGRTRYFDAPLVRSAPSRLLPTLAGWLMLDTPLSERYRTFSRTRAAGAGDTSPALAAGRILRETPSSGIEFDTELLQQAEAAYRGCRACLIANAAGTLT